MWLSSVWEAAGQCVGPKSPRSSTDRSSRLQHGGRRLIDLSPAAVRGTFWFWHPTTMSAVVIRDIKQAALDDGVNAWEIHGRTCRRMASGFCYLAYRVSRCGRGRDGHRLCAAIAEGASIGVARPLTLFQPQQECEGNSARESHSDQALNFVQPLQPLGDEVTKTL
jgi:hypothetical protein